MNELIEPQETRVAGFRTRLLIAIMFVVSAVTLLALYFGQRSLVANVEEDLEREFQTELAALRTAQAVRLAGLVERCRVLVRRPRIRAAFEDDALDLLYLTAEDELRDVLANSSDSPSATERRGLHASVYWFLDRHGAAIPPPGRSPRRPAPRGSDFARVAPIGLPETPATPQVGYVEFPSGPGGSDLAEIIAMPILSSETGEAIAALVLGFPKPVLRGRGGRSGMTNGIWLGGRLFAADLPSDAVRMDDVNAAVESPVRVSVRGASHLMFSQRLNPNSLYPPAFEVCLYPLADLVARQRELRWQVLGAGALLLLLGLAGSHLVSTRLARPVEKLAADSAEDRVQRVRAEAALSTTSAELQRSARFSADASHQLKTPVTVLRAGLEELMAREKLTTEECHEISALIHQTYRLSSLIDDLLLLSRMDAGRLKLEFSPVNLSQLIEASLDDLSALPDGFEVAVETDFPAGLHIAGEKRYTAIILQNLLENARKYNRPDGHIRIAAAIEREDVRLTIGNNGRAISPAAQEHIFERFHRGAIGENVPGYGLGLNLARELARLHLGKLRLLRSDESWTEFEVRFRPAQPDRVPATNP
ncbi:MAG: HAMP domain-containing histidine kinase [Opitutus sp.]|nr:HAMP domain-containing histidine kinase [Opitutus sp.]